MRQSANRRSVPDVLTGVEVQKLLPALEPREQIMVLLDVATGLQGVCPQWFYECNGDIFDS